MGLPAAADPFEEELHDLVAQFERDPLGFAVAMFPWGEGPLAGKSLRVWQWNTLAEISSALQLNHALEVDEAIQMARSSGHGIGKSALVAIIILWAMATKEDTRGVVTANTENQLRTKTWPELAKWHSMCLVGRWFKLVGTTLKSIDPEHEDNWRIDAVPWSENNTEAFAGLHNEGKRILLLMDEGSAISDKIWEVAEGALTDEHTEILWLVFGNPTRNQGRFFDCFNRYAHRWRTAKIDSRDVEGTNKAQIQKWEEDWGEDSDFFRVRVRGEFPSASAQQLIPLDLVEGAMAREVPYTRPHIAILGVDVARFGDDQTVIRTRLGRDARQFPPIRLRNASTTTIAQSVIDQVDVLRTFNLRVVIMVDGTGGYGGNVVDKLRELGYDVIEVLFSAKADNPKAYFNKRSEMYGRLKDWLGVGYLDPDDQDLKTELTGVMYMFRKDAIALEPKEVLKDREGWSPDDADALALTFAYSVEELPANDPLRTRPTAPKGAADARRAYSPFASLNDRRK